MADERHGAGTAALEPEDSPHATVTPSRWQQFLASATWLRHWELWLAVALAALLRLWHPEQSQFLDDQAALMTLARDAVLRGAAPLTGIPSSIGTLNLPLSIDVLFPVTLFTRDPLLAVVLLALWNVLGVALLYIFTLRYFGRIPAAVAALLFAACGAAVNYSRFIWQQNYLPPLLVLWAWTLYAGCIRGRRGWLAVNLALLVIIISLHPTGIVLPAVTLVALLLAPRRPTRREVALGVGLVLLLLLPTLLWEALSGAADLTSLRQFSAHPSEVNFDVFLTFAHLLGGPTYNTDYGGAPFALVDTQAAYTQLHGLFAVLVRLAYLLYIASYILLMVLVFGPAIKIWRGAQPKGTRWRQAQQRLMAIWRGLRADTSWRAYLLLWLWLTLPALALLRHNKTLQPHYLFIVYPAVFLMAGIAMQRALALAPALPHLLAPIRPSLRLPTLPSVARLAIFALLGVLVAGQAAQSLLYTAAQAAGQVNNTTFGYPLGDLRNADTMLTRLQQQTGAQSILLSTPQPHFYHALDYMLVGEHSDRTGFFGACLLLPAQNAGPALVVSAQASSRAAALLPRLSNAHHMQSFAMPGVEPFEVYVVQGAAATLPGETHLTPAVYRGPSGERIRLESAALQAPGVLRLRWTVLDDTPAGSAPSEFHFLLHSADTTTGSTLAQGECAPTRWQAGQTLFTWVQTGDDGATTGTPKAGPALPQAPLALDVEGETTENWQRSVGPLRVLSGALAGRPLARIPGQTATNAEGGTAPGRLDAAGAYVVSIGELSHS
jgi:Dolichyl-phosphate-mannose-protein mannosyltransferase